MKAIDNLHAERIWTQSSGEELANTISHAAGLVGALIGTPILIFAAIQHGSTAFLVGSAIFAATVVLLYLGSTLYHIWPQTRAKCALQVIDHSAIFLLIAGTYTPFTLGPLRGPWGWSILGLVWALAIFGVVIKSVSGVRLARLSMFLYLGMGWLILIAIRPLWLAVPLPTLLWLFGGGVIYTAGVAFFLRDNLRYFHFVWHLFVLAGTCCHFLAVLSYVA